MRKDRNSLVVENCVRSPHSLIRHPDNPDPSEVRSVPLQMMIGPYLSEPAVCRQDLILLVLQQQHAHHFVFFSKSCEEFIYKIFKCCVRSMFNRRNNVAGIMGPWSSISSVVDFLYHMSIIKLIVIAGGLLKTPAMTSSKWKEANHLLRHLYTRVADHGLHHRICETKGFHSPNEGCQCTYVEDWAACITL